jgi:hypothetical protein
MLAWSVEHGCGDDFTCVEAQGSRGVSCRLTRPPSSGSDANNWSQLIRGLGSLMTETTWNQISRRKSGQLHDVACAAVRYREQLGWIRAVSILWLHAFVKKTNLATLWLIILTLWSIHLKHLHVLYICTHVPRHDGTI